MQKLIFATNNQHKTNEIRSLLRNQFEIVTLAEAGIHIEIPEPHDTIAQNAREKSATIYQLTGKNCFGEDTGLETHALNGEPGVKSARYAGEERDFEANNAKLLRNLLNVADRTAKFRTVISLFYNGAEYQFEGICKGRIADTPRGSKGFGYDPVFIPELSSRTFAEMELEEKNQYSHRGKALQKLVQFLLKQ